MKHYRNAKWKKANTWHFCNARCGNRIEPGEIYYAQTSYNTYHRKCMPVKERHE